MENIKEEETGILEKYRLVMEKAKALKEEGNKLYSNEKYEAASQRYQAALDGITHGLLNDLYFIKDKLYFESLMRTKKECKLNLSLMLVKLQRYPETIRECTDIIEQIEPNSAKAFHRRAIAYKNIGELSKSFADISKAHELSPNDDIISKEFDTIKAFSKMYEDELKGIKSSPKKEERSSLTKEIVLSAGIVAGIFLALALFNKYTKSQ